MSWQLIGTIAGPRGNDGSNGKDADPAIVAGLKAEIDGLKSELLKVKSSPTEDDVRYLVLEKVADAVAALPPAKDGRSLTVEDVAPLVASEVHKAISALPAPKEPVGVVGGVLDRSGHLVLTFSDGSTKDVGEVVGRDVDLDAVKRMILDEVAKIPRPADGKDGQDALGFDDIDVQHDGERTFSFKFVRGERVKEFGPFTVPLVIDRGVYQAGTVYEKGDGVTWAGSYWIAQESTTAKPGEAGMQSRAWRLAVKKGGDGKVGAKGDPGDRGPKGDQGPMGPARY